MTKNIENIQPAAAGGVAQARPARWWPAWLISLAAILAWIWVWQRNEFNHQERNIQSVMVGLSAAFLLFLWALLLARFSPRMRLCILLTTLAVLAITPAALRIKGVTGNLLPVLEWRWRRRTDFEQAKAVQPAQLPQRIPAAPSQDDFPQFLGPERNGILPSVSLDSDWTQHPPIELWRRSVGPGWSGFVIARRRAVTQEQRGEEETVVCYDVNSGALLWTHADRARYQTTIAGEGPRANAMIDQGRVFTFGATGILNCLDFESGRKVWSVDVEVDNHGRVNEWGMSASPLVVNGMVLVCSAGRKDRALVAYDAATGKRRWAAGNDFASYSSPQLVTFSGQPQILIFNARSLEAHAPLQGGLLWSVPWPGGHPHVSQPLVLPGEQVLISSGYGTGSELLQIKRDAAGLWSAVPLWKTIRMKSKFANLIYRDGFIYGLDDGILACLDARSGRVQWKEGRYGHGQLLLLRDALFILAENGDAALVAIDPGGWRERARLRVLSGKTWNPPAIAGDLLLVRNDTQAACFRLPQKKSRPETVGK